MFAGKHLQETGGTIDGPYGSTTEEGVGSKRGNFGCGIELGRG
jgi:hypothetical protein